MEYIITGIANVVVFVIEAIVSFFAVSIITPINGSMILFLTYFKTIDDYYIWIQAIGIMIAVGIFAFQCFRTMFYQYSAGRTDPIPMMLIKLVICTGSILSVISLSKWALEIGTYPISQAGLFDAKTYDVTEIIDSVAKQAQDSTDSFTEEVEGKDTSFLDKAASILSFDASSGIGLLAAVVVSISLVVIGWKLIKLLLEILERYVLLNVVLLLSPLAIGTVISRSTAGIFRKFLEMLVSTFLLLFLDLLFFRIILGAMYVAFSTDVLDRTFSNGSSPNVVLSVFIISALITITTSLDKHLSKLIVTGTTGDQLGIGGFLAAQAAGGLIRGGMKKALGGNGKAAGGERTPLGGKAGPGGGPSAWKDRNGGGSILNGYGAGNGPKAAERSADRSLNGALGTEGRSVFKNGTADPKDLYSAGRMIAKAGTLVDSGRCRDLADASGKVVSDALKAGDVNAAALTAFGMTKDTGIELSREEAMDMISGFEDAGILPDLSEGHIVSDRSARIFDGHLSFAYTDADGDPIENVDIVSACVSADEIGDALDSGKKVYELPGQNDLYAIVDRSIDGDRCIFKEGSKEVREWTDPEGVQMEEFEKMTAKKDSANVLQELNGR